MSDEQDKLKLSLEPPKLFGRKRKSASRAEASEPADAAPASSRPTEPAAEPEPSGAAVDEVESVEDPAEDPADQELTAVIEDVEAAETSPTQAPEETADPDAGEPVMEPGTAATELGEDAAAPEPVAEDPEEPAPQWAPAKEAAATRTPAAEKAQGGQSASGRVDVEPEPMTDTDLEDAEIAAMADRGPLLATYPAAIVSGLAVGAAMVVLTWLSLRGCESVRGTASCGGGPGFLLLVATFVVCVLIGSALLKAFDVPDPGSSSFLAVGLVAVVALLFLIDFLDSWVMLIVIPIISIGGFLASVWVTKTFVEPADT
ncbi:MULTISPECIES: hypothetical protein [Nocardioides]|uniref:Uncharacterized protein n=1 Tax=Nocardioides vastitatis TaxID=2568655 RepID=A0ABW0ZKA2_9ACTN|nr:hypothetical protein [Nocardioides sp.]THJ05121.1 hypothetical protein E7Z54_07745 [Nocardioides sp.]